MRIAVTAAAVCLSIVGLSVAEDARAAIKQFTNIPAQGLGPALQALSRQRDLQVVYLSDNVDSLRTDGAVGTLTADETLTQLLSGTGLTFRYLDDRTITLVATTASQATPQAMNSTIGPRDLRLAQNTSSTENTESQTPSENPQSTEKKTDSPSSEGESDKLEEVLVTGSRLKRVEKVGPLTVVVISREDIDRSGAATMREVLNTATQNAVARDESGNNTFLGASTVQLRGLPIGTTLMLLNGRRLGTSGAHVSRNFFDLNNIPLAAVERIEILTDSASAIYGADALGGAVNVILKRDFTGAGASLRYGMSGESDATERNASLAVGGRGEAFSGMLLLDYFDREPLRGTDRSLTSSRDFTRLGGEDRRSTFSYPANVYSLDGDPLPGLNSPFAGVPTGTDGTGLTAVDFQATDGALNLFDDARYRTLLGEANRKSAFASGRYTLTPTFSFFGEILYAHREQIIQFAPGLLFLGEFGFFQVPATNPFNPFGVDVGVDYSFVELGPQAQDSTTDFSRFLVGAEGNLGDRFDWQVYFLADRDESDVFNRNAVNAFLSSTVQDFLNSSDPNVALNVFSTTGNNNPATLDAIRASGETTDNLSTQAQMAEAIVRGPLFDLPAGPLNAVVGVNFRREKVDFRSPAFLDLLDERDVQSAFAEISVPLVNPAQRVPAIHSLELSAALRHDHYHDSEADLESSTDPQFGLTWRPIASLLVRSSYGEAFKEPTAFDLLFPRLNFTGSALDPLRGGETSVFIQTFGGNPELAPERGQSVTAGVVWEPSRAPGFSLSLNGFRVKQQDFITSLDVDTILANADLFPGRVVRNAPDPADPPGFAGSLVSVDTSNVNFGRLTVTGADFQLQYAFPTTAYGQFVSTVAGTYIDKYEILVTPGTEPLNLVNQANNAGYPLRFKGNAGVSWNGLAGWSASATARYLNSYTDYDGVSQLPSQTVFDVQLNYRFGDRGGVSRLQEFDATLGVINLTDEQGSVSNNFAGYDSQQSDMRGRFYYLSLNMKL